MEENKAKMVNMGVKGNGVNGTHGEHGAEKKKLTYEQLNDACNQLWQQNKQLVMRNRELEQIAINKRLDYLFKVLELSGKFSSDFVGDCAGEIEAAMTVDYQLDEDEINKNPFSDKENPKKELPKGMEIEGEDLKEKGL